MPDGPVDAPTLAPGALAMPAVVVLVGASGSGKTTLRATRRQDALAAFGVGYVADAPHLRRRDRTPHLRTAAEVGLPAVAVLTAAADLPELLRRNAARLPDERIPDDVVARQWHRRSLLSGAVLGDEGFDRVVEL